MEELSFGARLQQLRIKAHKTQKQIAECLRVTPQAYSQYERNTRRPDYEMLIRLADLYGVSLKYLLVGQEEGAAADSGNVAEGFSAKVSELPPEAQKALNEYYQFLRSRYMPPTGQ